MILNWISILGFTNLLKANVCPGNRLWNIFSFPPDTHIDTVSSLYLALTVCDSVFYDSCVKMVWLQWASRVWFIERKRPVICIHNGKYENITELLNLWGGYWWDTCRQHHKYLSYFTVSANQSTAVHLCWRIHQKWRTNWSWVGV